MSYFFVLLKLPSPPSEAFYLYNAARLDELGDGAGHDTVRIVLLGDSRLRFATYNDEPFAKTISEKIKRPVKTVRLVNNWAVFGDFLPFSEDILDVEPDLLVIQEEQLAKRRSQPAKTLIAREYMRWRLVGHGPWNPGEVDQAELQHSNNCEDLLDETVYERLERVSEWVSHDPTGATARQVLDFVSKAQARGIKVVLLTIPITAIGKDVLPAYRHENSIKVLATDRVIPDTAFCDVVHMNEAGRATYSHWLAGALADLFMKEEQGVQNGPTG